jgi:hypothetical protein
MTFTAIVTAHAQDPSKILGNLMYQTRKPDYVVVLHSDVDSLLIFKLERDLDGKFASICFLPRENREDWGHEKRAEGLELARGDAIGFFNADDSYDIHYVEKMMAEIEAGADAVYCAWNSIPNCTFGMASSTSGNFIVRTGLARIVGYTDRDYCADGRFIDKVRDHATHIHRVDDVLYFHNVQ